jgi:hypothetical protein
MNQLEKAKKEMLLFFINNNSELINISPVKKRLDYPKSMKMCCGTNLKICSSCKFYYLFKHRLNNLDGVERDEIIPNKLESYYFDNGLTFLKCFENINPESSRTLIRLDVDVLSDSDYFLKVFPFIVSLYG